MHQQLKSAKCVCYDLTPTKTHPYRRLPVNFNLLLLQQITSNCYFCIHTLISQRLMELHVRTYMVQTSAL